jgi:hypothetical protein
MRGLLDINLSSSPLLGWFVLSHPLYLRRRYSGCQKTVPLIDTFSNALVNISKQRFNEQQHPPATNIPALGPQII